MKKIFFYAAHILKGADSAVTNINIIGFCGILIILSSCQKSILEEPNNTGLVDINTVFSNANNAGSMLAANYNSSLVAGWSSNGLGQAHGCLGSYAGELSKGWNWHGSFFIATTGPLANATPGQDTKSGDAVSVADFVSFYPRIRANFIIIENIDKVPNLSVTTKNQVKGEAYGLIAYTYLQMFKNYGGVPIVTHSFLPTDNAAIPRATLQQTYNYIIQLCDTAIAALPATSYPTTLNGKLTQGAVMAIKAQAALFAARPLFNSATPYLDFGKNNNLICFGNAEGSRWNDVINYTNDAIDWASQNNVYLINTGNAGVNAPNPNALADYGTATSTPSNNELLLAYHVDNTTQSAGYYAYYNTSNYWTSSRYNNELIGLLRGHLTNYYKADGTNQSWPKAGDATPRPASDYVTRFKQMEPRFLADFIGPGLHAANNPTDQNWSDSGWNATMFNTGQSFPSGSYGHGCATQTKFYYRAGSRVWFEYPLIRMAELYLNLAEAYNELGDATNALINLNLVHNRAGLPSVVETDQNKLRAIIQREWAVEFFNESKRYYDVRHWKLSNIGTGGVYGPQEEFQFTCNLPSGPSVDIATNLINYWSAVTFTSYWNPKMFLEPFPIAETNKGNILQNPGY